MSSAGTKVTSTEDVKVENPGIVTSDSLAAESVKSGGDFAANSNNREPLSQPSASTTSNVTDTSSAVELPSAPDRPRREDGHEYVPGEEASSHQSHAKQSTQSGSTGASASQAASTEQKPKGKDLHEGGFDSSAPNASWTTDIGSKKDPGRVALQHFEEENNSAAHGAGPRQTELASEGQFDALKQKKA